MDFKKLKSLSELSDDMLTDKFVSFFDVIMKYHDEGKGLSHFDWHNLEVSPDGKFYINDIKETKYTEEVCKDNYLDYAALIYCVCTKQKSPESMSWDAGRKIKQPVLREIVLTFCGRNYAIRPLIAKLRKPYVDEEQFFKGYTTVDEKEASEKFAEKERIRQKNEMEELSSKILSATKTPRTPWYKGIGVFLIMALCYGGYKACKANEKAKTEAAGKVVQKEINAIHQRRELIREKAKNIHISIPNMQIKTLRTTSHGDATLADEE